MTGSRLRSRLLGGIDLVIELATLGEFGLETLPDAAECERTGHGWEALAPARRGGCARRWAVVLPSRSGFPY
jgi:hypothetical protein